MDPVFDADKQSKVSIAFLTNDVTEVYESFVMRIVASLLLDGPQTPLYRALIDSGLGSDFSPNTGYDYHSRETSFAVGLQVWGGGCFVGQNTPSSGGPPHQLPTLSPHRASARRTFPRSSRPS